MPKKSLAHDAALIEILTRWREQAFSQFFRGRKIGRSEHSEFLTGTKRLIHTGLKNGSFRLIAIKGNPLAVIARWKAPNPRIKNQQQIVFFFEPTSLKQIRTSIKREIGNAAEAAPTFTEIGVPPQFEKLLAPTLKESGFTVRYEILQGNTTDALRKLVRIKQPPRDLKHLGLELRALKSESDLRKALKLQKYVATKEKSHSYFSYTRAQLKKDKKEYKALIGEDRGLLLGVFKGSTLFGLMFVGVYGENRSQRHGSFSFFLHDSIQGMGITKTGYRLMLEYLKKSGINTFYGGTSQPAIQAMGKVMGRTLQRIVYLKL